jgi:VWFA-related protein
MTLPQCFALAFVLGCVAPAWAQLAPAPRTAEAAGTREGRIEIDAVVTDMAGKPVHGLELKDFTLLDDKHPAMILTVHSYDAIAARPAPPTEVIIVLDAVNFEARRLIFKRQEIERFLRQNGGHLAQPVSVFLLTGKGVNVQPRPYVDGNALAGEIHKFEPGERMIGDSAGATGAIERSQLSVQMFMGIVKSESKKPNRKLLIWVGPGWPLLSGVVFDTTAKARQQYFNSIVELSTMMREARIALYSVSAENGVNNYLYEVYLQGVKLERQAEAAGLALKVIVVQSGGRILGPNNDLAGQITDCVGDANAFYTLSFDPQHADRANEYHDLKVLVEQPGLSVRANTGYYNQP